jgi:hypothetical protein
MITFYVVLGLVTLPLIWAHPKDIVGWAMYLCSVIFQGISLPILGYTSRKAGEKSDKVMEHILKLSKDIDKVVKHIDEQEHHIHEEIDEILDIEKKKA